MDAVAALAEEMSLAGLLDRMRADHAGYDLVDQWTQGEFHHDIVLRHASPTLPGPILVVSTNCNGGVKEVLCFAAPPDRWALWHHRCPSNPDFSGTLLPILALARTPHYFDPCELLTPDARSELLPSCRRRARGGGWEPLP